MASKDYTEEATRVVIRIRELIALDYGTKRISEITGRSEAHVSNIKAGRKWNDPKIPITYFGFRKTLAGERCKNPDCTCKTVQLLTKDNLCSECALLWLHKLGFLKVGESLTLEERTKGDEEKK